MNNITNYKRGLFLTFSFTSITLGTGLWRQNWGTRNVNIIINLINLLNIKLYNDNMNAENLGLVKITSSGTISIPKQFRMYLEMQKGDYVKIILEKDHLVIQKATVS